MLANLLMSKYKITGQRETDRQTDIDRQTDRDRQTETERQRQRTGTRALKLYFTRIVA